MPSDRTKSFTAANAQPLDRNQKSRIEFFAKAYSRRNKQPGQHGGPLSRVTLGVLKVLLWQFHNARTGLCIPSYEKIAEAAECSRSMVAEAIKALEFAGVLTWIHRLKTAWCGPPDLLGEPTKKTHRSSNSYAFQAVGQSKSDFPTGTPNQAFDSSLAGKAADQPPPVSAALGAALTGLGAAVNARDQQIAEPETPAAPQMPLSPELPLDGGVGYSEMPDHDLAARKSAGEIRRGATDPGGDLPRGSGERDPAPAGGGGDGAEVAAARERRIREKFAAERELNAARAAGRKRSWFGFGVPPIPTGR